MDRSILEEIEKFVIALFATRLPKWRTFHNIQHTTEVVYRCDQMANHYILSDKEYEVLLTAAWFHDTGYCRGELEHEQESAKIARGFLSGYSIDEPTQLLIDSTIKSTHYGTTPESILQMIICDADMYHLGSTEYQEWSGKLKHEVETQNAERITDYDWNIKNVEFFKRHFYHTDFAKKSWDKQKQINLDALNELIRF